MKQRLYRICQESFIDYEKIYSKIKDYNKDVAYANAFNTRSFNGNGG